jgi:hypothetical protein
MCFGVSHGCDHEDEYCLGFDEHHLTERPLYQVEDESSEFFWHSGIYQTTRRHIPQDTYLHTDMITISHNFVKTDTHNASTPRSIGGMGHGMWRLLKSELRPVAHSSYRSILNSAQQIQFNRKCIFLENTHRVIWKFLKSLREKQRCSTRQWMWDVWWTQW